MMMVIRQARLGTFHCAAGRAQILVETYFTCKKINQVISVTSYNQPYAAHSSFFLFKFPYPLFAGFFGCLSAANGSTLAQR
jgi:hypothetical protein